HEVDAVMARALAKDPAERFHSAGDLARAAETAAQGGVATLQARTVATGEAATGVVKTLPSDPTVADGMPVLPSPRRRRTGTEGRRQQRTEAIAQRSRNTPWLILLIALTGLAAAVGVLVATGVRDTGRSRSAPTQSAPAVSPAPPSEHQRSTPAPAPPSGGTHV